MGKWIMLLDGKPDVIMIETDLYNFYATYIKMPGSENKLCVFFFNFIFKL